MVEVKEQDIEFLKDEYKEARRQYYNAGSKGDKPMTNLNRGIGRGLEIALVRIGVTNDELDRISEEAYNEL